MTATLDPIDLERALAALDADALDHLGLILRERARLRRVLVTEDEARHAVECAPLSPWWERSVLSDVGRVRAATAGLIRRGFRPIQIAPAMAAVALPLCPHPVVAAEAVAAGIADGMADR